MHADWLELIAQRRHESCAVKQAFSAALDQRIATAAELLRAAVDGRRHIIAFGNGGSAADAQHFVAELVGHFEKERRPIAAVALTTNSSNLTSLANDYGFGAVFERPVRAWTQQGDVVLAISTSGDSDNVLRGAQAAHAGGAQVIGLTGVGGGALAALCDVLLDVPSSVTARVQEAHILVLHTLAELIEL